MMKIVAHGRQQPPWQRARLTCELECARERNDRDALLSVDGNFLIFAVKCRIEAMTQRVTGRASPRPELNRFIWRLTGPDASPAYSSDVGLTRRRMSRGRLPRISYCPRRSGPRRYCQ